MTFLHGPRSGDQLRSRRRHDLPAGPAEQRLHRDPRLEHGRVPSGRVPVGHGGARRVARRSSTSTRRFTRTSAVADIHVPLRAGSDIAFLGGIVNYILENDRFFRDYVVHYTNAPAILREDFRDTEDLDGLFSGWDDDKRIVRPDVVGVRRRRRRARRRSTGGVHDRAGLAARHCARAVHFDPTLEDPRCVFQVLKRHYSRYTPEMVEDVCGVPPEQFLQVAEALVRELRSRAHVGVLLRGRAGRSTPSACSTSAPPPSCSCCSATSAVRAAGSWPSAATPRSRARPMCRRCTTCCPATCRCRRRSTTPRSAST